MPHVLYYGKIYCVVLCNLRYLCGTRKKYRAYNISYKYVEQYLWLLLKDYIFTSFLFLYNGDIQIFTVQLLSEKQN